MKLTTEQKRKKALRLYEVLLTVKEKCDNGDFIRNKESVRDFLYNQNFKNSNYLTALNRLNILYTDDFLFVRWKENIPVSEKLSLTVLNKASEIYKEYVNKRKKRTEIQQVKPKKITLPIVDKNKIEKFSKGSKRVGAGRKPLQKNLQKVGLIRRFLRWIY